MKQLTREINELGYRSKALDFYFPGMKLGILDIETTGLNPDQNHFILGGLASFSDRRISISQFFSESIEEEQQTLAAFLKEVEKFDLLLTYNGKHFDIPFIERRGRGFCPQLPYNLDLYLILNKYSSLRKFLPNLKQKTVENFMGLWDSRTDEISGRESVMLYNEFLATGNDVIKDKILLHNADDVLQLSRLLKVLEKSDLHRAMHHMGFPVKLDECGKSILQVKKIDIVKNRLEITGYQSGRTISYQAYEPYYVSFSQVAGTFKIRLPLLQYSEMKILDLRKLSMDTSPFEKYPDFGDGLLIIERDDQRNYLEINHFVKQLIERNWIDGLQDNSGIS